MATIRFSLVIPCHNGASYIVRCLSSIAQQTFPLDNVEVVFVDDGSTDGSGIIAERFAEDFPRFQIMKNDAPSGPGGARNRGVEKATGEYLFLVDVDDWLPPKSLEIIDKVITDNKNPDVVLFPYRIDRPKSSRRTRGLVQPKIKDIQQLFHLLCRAWCRK